MFGDILARATEGKEITIAETAELLSASSDEELDALFAAARRCREKVFGNKVFTYGFVYFSTHCKNDCSFCFYRRSNRDIGRYRKSKEEIVQLAGDLRDAGINLADLTMGEDPSMYRNGCRELLDIISAVKEQVGICIMTSPGALPEPMFREIRRAGADWYACYQETYNRELFSRMRLGQDFDVRMNQKRWAHEAGLLAEDGMMVGLGESIMDRADTILKMGATGSEQIRAMTFIPQDGTPMRDTVPSDTADELKAIAVMRILFPDRLIPCSLDIEGIAGLRPRLEAGANVITSIIPPRESLAGVAQHDLDIENGNRSVQHVFELLDELGYVRGTDNEYRLFIESRRSSVG